MVKATYILYIFVFILHPTVLLGHGDLHERIEVASEAIQIAPDSAELYLERGILFFQHEKYNESIHDLNYCAALNYNSQKLDLAFAKANLKLNNAQTALFFLDKILKEDPNHVITLRWKAKALMQLDQYTEAAYYFEKVIEKADKTFTENYMEAAFAWEYSKHERNIENSIAIIEKGIVDLGDLILFYDRLVDLNQLSGNIDNAIINQNKIIELSNRKERPYYQRALIYLSNGNIAAARADLTKSKEEIDKLPERIKKNNATQVLIKNIREKELLL